MLYNMYMSFVLNFRCLILLAASHGSAGNYSGGMGAGYCACINQLLVDNMVIGIKSASSTCGVFVSVDTQCWALSRLFMLVYPVLSMFFSSIFLTVLLTDSFADWKNPDFAAGVGLDLNSILVLGVDKLRVKVTYSCKGIMSVRLCGVSSQLPIEISGEFVKLPQKIVPSSQLPPVDNVAADRVGSNSVANSGGGSRSAGSGVKAKAAPGTSANGRGGRSSSSEDESKVFCGLSPSIFITQEDNPGREPAHAQGILGLNAGIFAVPELALPEIDYVMETSPAESTTSAISKKAFEEHIRTLMPFVFFDKSESYVSGYKAGAYAAVGRAKGQKVDSEESSDAEYKEGYRDGYKSIEDGLRNKFNMALDAMAKLYLSE